MTNQKHLTLDDRSNIQAGLNSGKSFRQIAHDLNKDPTTIAKEVHKHRSVTHTGAFGRIPNKCLYRKTCSISGLCNDPRCNRRYCRSCSKCNLLCSNFTQEYCPLPEKAPYVCNGCQQKSACVLDKYLYNARNAFKQYADNLSDCRSGCSYNDDELRWLNDIVTPAVMKNQSLHHIWATSANKLICSERTLYRLIDQCAFDCRNIDLVRKVRYHPRQGKKSHKVDKNCRKGRTWQDFKNYMQEYPDTPVVEIDSVEGRKGGKVMLTIIFTLSDLVLIYLRDQNTAQSVIDVFNDLYCCLGHDLFMQLFPLLLGDNGSEFSNPQAIEHDDKGGLRTRLFYCDPSSPYQKGALERSHEYIRMVLPKGSSFDHLTQDDVSFLASNINSLVRKKLNDRSPMTVFSFFHGADTLLRLGLKSIPPDQVNLTPRLFALRNEVNRHE